MSVIGVEQFAGHRCYHVRGITLWKNVNNQYYDVDEHLLVPPETIGVPHAI